MQSEPTYEEIISLKESGVKDVWVVLSKKYNKSKDSIRSKFDRERKKRNAYENLLDIEQDTVSDDGQEEKEYKAEKSFSFDDMGNPKYVSSRKAIMMTEAEEMDSNFVLNAHGFDYNEWIIVNLTNNYWQAMRADDLGAATLYQSKLVIKPKSEKNTITLDDVDNFLKKYEYEKFSQSNKNFSHYNKNGKTLIINLADPHYGCEEKNITTVEKVNNLIQEIIIRAERFRFSKIILANLGDILHFDNDAGQTTSGTQVGDRGIIYHFWEEALKSLIESVYELKKLAPVEFIGIGGNHDKVNSFTLSKALQYHFSKDIDVSFDVDFQHRKYKTIGNSVFGFCHGDIPAKNISTLIQREAREMYGKSKHAYVLLGHIHHINVRDENGVIIYNLPSLSHTDYWHDSKAYTGAWHGTWCFVVDDIRGIEDTWQIEA